MIFSLRMNTSREFFSTKVTVLLITYSCIFSCQSGGHEILLEAGKNTRPNTVVTVPLPETLTATEGPLKLIDLQSREEIPVQRFDQSHAAFIPGAELASGAIHRYRIDLAKDGDTEESALAVVEDEELLTIAHEQEKLLSYRTATK